MVALVLPTTRPRWRRNVMSVLVAVLLLPLLLWLAAIGLLWWQQERLLFAPERLPASEPLALEADVHERFVDVPGARLSVLELRLPDPKGVVYFLHGNGGSLKGWFVNTAFYRQAGYDLVMPDYRGYGKSTGRIESEAQLHADVEAVWRSVEQRYAGKPVVVYGRSLGSGLAARLAAKIQPELTVLVSPYRSMAALAQAHYPWVPGAVLRYPLRTDLSLRELRRPVLLVHGDRDALIDAANAHALLQDQPAARIALIEGAGHGDVHDFEAYRSLLAQALAELPAAPR